MSDQPTQPNAGTLPETEAVSWNAIWIAIQELGAAMRPLLDSHDAPEWAINLGDALTDADRAVEGLAMEEVDDEPLYG